MTYYLKNKAFLLRFFFLICYPCLMGSEKYYLNGDEKVKDAIDISFAEAFFAGHDRQTVQFGWPLFPDVLKKLYVDFWGTEPIQLVFK
ncbi:hypothetical protein JQC92_20890 [Shewanella sp. 202IG2-18]|uniref:DUF7674 family protein n=1 Tax=Parashewanella hymeniacidonis TaxID=2807618 RepID=UPI0019605D5F|nr:hypothetical protein [Parashewanella hymeniacidonis]MBM7074448.1 hypothetical protein [Parashewanella hymeniacidonis]